MNSESQYPNLSSCNPQICISRKITTCNRIVASVFRKHLKPFNITNSQLSTLFIISKAPDPTLKLLSDKMYMDKSTVNRNLKRLIENKLIEKLTIHDLQITKKGKVLLEDVIPHWEKAMKEIRELLEEEGESALNIVLHKLT